MGFRQNLEGYSHEGDAYIEAAIFSPCNRVFVVQISCKIGFCPIPAQLWHVHG